MTREEALKQWLPIVVMGVREMPEVKEAVKMAITALEQQPSSSENPSKWIPVSERLPEDNTLVLVTVKVGNREPKVRSGYYYMDGHFHIDNGDSWEARDKELIAWMPLPEPYAPDINVGNMSEIPTGEEGRVDKDGGEENAN